MYLRPRPNEIKAYKGYISPPSTSVSSDFMVLCKCLKKKYTYRYFTLPCRGLSLVGLALYLVD